jgi:CheY-like chemotaxis protein
MNLRAMGSFLGILASGVAAAVLFYLLPATRAQSAQNPIQIENARAGTTAWQIDNPANNFEIEGYVSAVSINRGDSIKFYVNTRDPRYTWQIFRMGWYGGLGGRAITSPATRSGVRQAIPSQNACVYTNFSNGAPLGMPAPATCDPVTGMVECNWSSPITVTTSNSDPSQWVSGFYLVKLTGSSGKQRYIPFIVCDDTRASDILWHVSTNTYEAYNAWGGKGLYAYNSSPSIPQAQVGGAGLNSAVKVSFNRPYDASWGAGQFLNWDFDMLGFLEEEGYDVTYEADLDFDSNASPPNLHKAIISVAHNEYWTLQMRQNITTARDLGISLGFFGANTLYWQIRYEPSPISGVANRTVVGYKEDAAKDPDAQSPSTYPLISKKFRDPHGSLPAQPEDALVGVMYDYSPVDNDILVVNPSHWVFAGTGLNNGSHLPGLLGYEVDREFGHQPSNTVVLAHSPYTTNSGSTQFADMTIYQASSGAWVFGAGTIQSDALSLPSRRIVVTRHSTRAPLPAIPRLGVTCRWRNGRFAMKPTIHVIDDDASTRRALTRLILSLGFEVEVFDSAEAFLAEASPASCSCLLVDVHMPGMSGVDLCRKLAASGSTLPTILMSARADAGTKMMARSARPVTTLFKPFDEEALLSAISLAMQPSSPRS